MGLVTVSIDGKSVQVPEGTSVLEAARTIGIKIPALCYDPDLSRVGACRLCVVEIEKMRGLPAACVTTCTEGMIIQTRSPAVVEARRVILELLIANHPLDCLTCEKNGECLLQEYCYDYRVATSAFTGTKYAHAVDDSNPFYVRDMNKCVLCGRCVRVCEEVTGRGILEFSMRGHNAKVTTFMDQPVTASDCAYCGNCVAVCPTGALTERDMIGKGRKCDINKVRTVCPYCGAGCTIDLNVKDGRIIGVTGNPDGDVNSRFLCVKGRFGYQFIHSEDRLKTPLVKQGSTLEETSWDDALALVGNRLREIVNTYGPESVGVLSSARCTNEENYLLSKFARAVLGTNNIDHCARL